MAAHTYWRLMIGATDSGTTLTLAQFELRATTGGTNLAVASPGNMAGGTPTAQTSFNAVANAFDGDVSTYWGGGGTLPNWLRYTFPVANDIVLYTITGSTSWAGWEPTAWTLEYSTNGGSTWTVADTRSGQSWTSGEKKSYTLTSVGGGGAVDWRLNFSAAGTAAYGFMSEVEFLTGAGSNLPATTASTTTSGSPAGNATDANNATAWSAAASTTSGWIAYHFTAAQDIVEHAVTAPAATMTNAPKNWTIQYSDDGVTWTTAAIVGGQTGWTTNEQRVFTHSSYPTAIGCASLLPARLTAATATLPVASTRATLRNDAALQTAPMISGTVKQGGTACARTVRAYCRLTGELLGEAVSDGSTGAFSINARGRLDNCYVVALDDLLAAPDYNAQILDLIIPA